MRESRGKRSTKIPPSTCKKGKTTRKRESNRRAFGPGSSKAETAGRKLLLENQGGGKSKKSGGESQEKSEGTFQPKKESN